VNDEISGKAQLPQTVTNYRTDSKEATPEEITRVYQTIRKLYNQDREWVSYCLRIKDKLKARCSVFQTGCNKQRFSPEP